MSEIASSAVHSQQRFTAETEHANSAAHAAGVPPPSLKKDKTQAAASASQGRSIPRNLRVGVRVFKPYTPVKKIAHWIVERAWIGKGVRVFLWPCGTWGVVAMGTHAEQRLIEAYAECLVGTWAQGALLDDVLAEVNWLNKT